MTRHRNVATPPTSPDKLARRALVATHDSLLGWLPTLGGRLHRIADRVSLIPLTLHHSAAPRKVIVNGVALDVIGDLVAYTGLPEHIVVASVERRVPSLAFQCEWQSTPSDLRSDRWFYLSSKAYLFGNAGHPFDADLFERLIRPSMTDAGRLLDFGAGVGSQSMGIAAHGIQVSALELSALQRDFIGFRAQRHGLVSTLYIVEPWTRSAGAEFDVVLALDVFEHLPACATTIETQILPVLADGGTIIENSPFVTDYRNPMHHDDFGFVPWMHSKGFTVIDELPGGTRAWRRTGTAART